MKPAASVEMLKGQDRGGRGSGEKNCVSLSCTHRKGAESCAGEKGWCRIDCCLPTGGEMGQSFDSGLNFGLWSLVGRHVCFLTLLQPADNSLHNAAAQIGSRGF